MLFQRSFHKKATPEYNPGRYKGIEGQKLVVEEIVTLNFFVVIC